MISEGLSEDNFRCVSPLQKGHCEGETAFHRTAISPVPEWHCERYNSSVTYGLFLFVFLVIPIVLLAVGLRKYLRRAHCIAMGLICAVAFLYTTPWDNYAAYKKLWSFDAAFVWGKPFWFYYLPLEEYLFYLAEAGLVCLTLLFFARFPTLAPDTKDL